MCRIDVAPPSHHKGHHHPLANLGQISLTTHPIPFDIKGLTNLGKQKIYETIHIDINASEMITR